VWTVDDDVPGLPGADRRMSIIRRSDGSLVFFNAIPVADETLAQVKALGIAQSVVHPQLGETTLVGQPVELSRTPGAIETPTPAHGAHTADVLREIGYDAQEIAGLRAAGVL